MTTPSNQPDQPPSRSAQLAGSLARLRKRLRRAIIIRTLGLGLGICVAVLLGVVLIDFALRLPTPIRVINLALGIAGLVWAYLRFIRPALRFNPTDTALALRSQALLDDGTHHLASAIELDRAAAADPLERALSKQAIDRTLVGFDPARIRGTLNPRPTRIGIAAAALALAAVLIGVLWQPTIARIGTARALAPWTHASWPKRQTIADATDAQAHPIDRALPIRAVVLRSNRPAGRTPVTAHYRLITGSHRSPWTPIPLTAQGRDAAAPGTNQTGELFERLVETDTPDAAGSGDARIEYYIQTADDRTPRRKVRLVDPPSLLRASAVVIPPAYTSQGESSDQAIASGRIELDPSGQGDALLGPVLEGSRVTLDLSFNKPITLDESSGWLAELRRAGERLELASAGDTARVSLTLTADVRTPIELTDEHGIANRHPPVLTIDALADAPPTAAVIEPARDEQVLAGAQVELVGEAGDDFGIDWARLEMQTASPPPGSAGAPPEPSGAWHPLAEASVNAGQTIAPIALTLDLERFAVSQGDEILLSVLAADRFILGDRRHDPVRSGVRRLMVIDESTLVDQVRAEFGAIRQAAMRIDEQQAQAQHAAGEQHEQVQRQEAITRAVRAQSESIRRLGERVRQNRLDDQSLSGLLSDAGETLAEASQSSAKASRALGNTDPDRANAQQSRVRDLLGELVAMLDRGQDGWLARRSLERLIADEQRLTEQTAAAGAGTVGRSLDQLSEQEQTDLERIAARQRELADQAESTIEELDERAGQLEKSDPVQSAAMAQAAKAARENRAADKLSQAARQIGSNQTGAAQSSQEDALDALREALDELDDAERNRDDALRRQLASLIASIETLIRRQRQQLTRLDSARALDGLAEPMIALHAQSLAAGAQAESMREMRPVARLLGSAADEQAEAIAELRAPTADHGAVREHELRSQTHLEDALAEAKRLEKQAKQRESRRVRAELRKAYRDALEQQAAIKGDAQVFIGARLNRRQRSEARKIAAQQLALRAQLDDLRTKTDELADARVFEFAHRRLDAAMLAAGDELGSGSPTVRVARRQQESIDLLGALAEALADSKQEPDAFQSAQSGGGGGQGGQGQDQPAIPPIAELKLLRAMQRQASVWTRSLDDPTVAPDTDELSMLGSLQRELADHAAALIEANKRQPPRMAPPPSEPSGEPPAEPIEQRGETP